MKTTVYSNPTGSKVDKKVALQKPIKQWPEPSTPDDLPFRNLKIPMGHAKAN